MTLIYFVINAVRYFIDIIRVNSDSDDNQKLSESTSSDDMKHVLSPKQFIGLYVNVLGVIASIYVIGIGIGIII